LAPARAESLQRHVEVSADRLAEGNARHFADCVPVEQHWRLYREFAGSTAFLDIETTGLSGHSDHIITAVVYDRSPTTSSCGTRRSRAPTTAAAVSPRQSVCRRCRHHRPDPAPVLAAVTALHAYHKRPSDEGAVAQAAGEVLYSACLWKAAVVENSLW